MSERAGRLRTFFESIGSVGLYPLIILCAFAWIDEFDQVAFGALSPEIRHFFHLSEASFILIVSLSGALSILASAPLGYLADRSNRVRISQIAAIVWGIAALGTGLAPLLGLLIAARFVAGIGRLVNEPVHPSLLSDYYPPASLPSVFAVHRFAIIFGNIAGPIAGVIAAAFAGSISNWRPVFVILAAPMFLFVVLSLRMREPLRGESIDATQAARNTEHVPFGEAYRR